MKRCIFVMLAVALSFGMAMAQTAFKNGTNVLQFGIGYGLLNTYGDATTPPVSATLDFATSKDLSVGGYVGYAASRQIIYPAGYAGVVTSDMGADYSYFIFGGRACYHFDTGNKNFDGYIGAMLGYNAVTATGFGSAGSSNFNVTYGASALLYGGQLGGRYYLSPNVALFGEIGYGVGYITGGISFRV